MRRTLRSLCGCLCAALLGNAGSARAVDGVLEINDAIIIAAGGYPYVIPAATPGSYVLTGNLTPPAATNAIDVLAADVTIDLNGFQILGSGGGTGINGLSSGLTVRNGIVTGFAIGISAGDGAKIFQVKVTSNTGTGISGSGCLVVESTVGGSNGVGIAGTRCKIENNVIDANTGVGIVGSDNVIVNNHIEANGGGGILAMPGGGTIQENVIVGNPTFGVSDGIFGPPPPPPPPPLPARANLRGNTIGANGGPGISFVTPVLINDNTVSGNTGSGIVCAYACTLHANVIDANNTGLLVGSGGAVVGPGGNVTDNSISFNNFFGLTISVLSGYSQNTLNANAGPDEIPVGGLVHPTSFMHNLCSGVVGPAVTCP